MRRMYEKKQEFISYYSVAEAENLDSPLTSLFSKLSVIAVESTVPNISNPDAPHHLLVLLS